MKTKARLKRINRNRKVAENATDQIPVEAGTVGHVYAILALADEVALLRERLDTKRR